MPIVHVPEAPREKLGPEGAQALVDLLNQGAVKPATTCCSWWALHPHDRAFAHRLFILHTGVLGGLFPFFLRS